MWIFDLKARVAIRMDSADKYWEVIKKFPPPENWRSTGKHIFIEYLRPDKTIFLKTTIAVREYELNIKNKP